MIMRLYDAVNSNHVYYEHINLCATISNYLFPARTVHPRLLSMREENAETRRKKSPGIHAPKKNKKHVDFAIFTKDRLVAKYQMFQVQGP